MRRACIAIGLATLAAASAGAFVACATTEDDARAPIGTSPPDGEAGASDATPDAPSPRTLTHRPVPVRCGPAMRRPPGEGGADAAPDAAISCRGDDECTAASEGRCSVLRGTGPAWFSLGVIGTECTYDACTADEDCTRGVCGCDIGFGGQHICLSNGNCRVDADCGDAGEVCAFSLPLVLPAPGVVRTGNEVAHGAGHPPEALGWFCTTPHDTCRDPYGPNRGPCVYDPNLGHWYEGYNP